MDKFEMWPVHPRRLPDELLSSWLMRIAHAHGLKLHTLTHRAFPGYSIWNRDIDKTASNSFLSILSQRTGRPFTEVYQSTLRGYEGYLFENLIAGNTKWISPVGIYHRIHKRKGLAACPLCLTENNTPYFRRLWRIGFSVVCTKHSVWMINECPSCNSPIAFHRNDFLHKYNATQRNMNICYSCGFDYIKAELVIETDQVFLIFLRSLEKTLITGYIEIGSSVVYSHLYFEVLRQLLKLLSVDKHGIKLRNLLEQKLDITCDSILNTKTVFIDALPLCERRFVLRLISRLIIDWPQLFIETCKEIKLTRSRLERDMKTIPFWYSQILRNTLDETSYGPSTDEIKIAYKYLYSLEKKVTLKLLLKVMGYRDSKLINQYWRKYHDSKK